MTVPNTTRVEPLSPMNLAKLRARIAVGLLALTFLASVWQVFFRKTFEENADAEHELHMGHWFLNTGMREAFDATIEDYQRLNPQVRLKQIPVSIRTYPAWARTQLIGDTAPDIVGMLSLNEDMISRYYLPLTPWLSQPNPYNKGTSLEGVPWQDTFFDGLSGIRGLTPSTNEVSGIIIQINSLRLYYNHEMLREITGSDTPPNDFADLKALSQKIDTYNARTGKKIIPIAGCGPYARYAFDRILPSQTQRLTLSHSPDRNLRMTVLEMAALMLDGTFSYTKTPEFLSSLELMREVSLLLTPGFMQFQRDEAVAAFVQQRSLMIIAGSWDYATLLDGAGTTFEIKALPILSPSEHDPKFGQFTLGQAAEGMGIEGSMGIVRTSKNQEMALDFLHFLTSQPAAEQFMQISQKTTAIVDAKLPESLEQIKPDLVGEVSGFGVDFAWFSAGNSSNHFQRHLHEVIGTQANVPAVAEKLDAEMGRYIRDDIAAHLKLVRRTVRRLDALLTLNYTLPREHSAQMSWTRHSEIQHQRQLENLQYSPYATAQ